MEQKYDERLKQIENNVTGKLDGIKGSVDRLSEKYDDKKYYYPKFFLYCIGVTVTIVTLLLFVFGLWSVINFNSGINKLDKKLDELNKLNDKLSSKIENKIGEIDILIAKLEKKPEPELELYDFDGKHLDGTKLPAIIKIKDKKPILRFWITFKNAGNCNTDPLFIKMYFNKPLSKEGDLPPTDETGFDTEEMFTPEKLPGKGIVPVGLTWRWKADLKLKEKNIEKIRKVGKHHFMIKVYFGLDKIVQANFFVIIKETLKFSS